MRKRTGLHQALAFVRTGDVLVTWKPDQLGRSLPHLVETVAELGRRGVGFRSITEAIDATTPGGRLVFHLFGALGQFERDLIQERTRAGLAAAAARGRKGGRKPVITAEKLACARAIITKGLTVREAATRLMVSKTALYEALATSASEGDSITKQEHTYSHSAPGCNVFATHGSQCPFANSLSVCSGLWFGRP